MAQASVKQQIVPAAEWLFAERGLGAVSLCRLGAAAGNGNRRSSFRHRVPLWSREITSVSSIEKEILVTPGVQTDERVSEPEPAGLEPVDEDLLVEEVSIDGMCGVY